MTTLYKRSSFLRLLTTKYGCTLTPLKDGRVIKVENGPMKDYIFVSKHDRIDYEEIYIHYQKLLLTDLPSHSELELAD